MIEKVVPSIKGKWLRDGSSQTIFIQHDNARTHINCDDEKFHRVAIEDGFDTQLMYQPPKSPNLNILDLEFVSAIRSWQHKKAPKFVNDVINAIVKAYGDFSMVMLNHIF